MGLVSDKRADICQCLARSKSMMDMSHFRSLIAPSVSFLLK